MAKSDGFIPAEEHPHLLASQTLGLQEKPQLPAA